MPRRRVKIQGHPKSVSGPRRRRWLRFLIPSVDESLTAPIPYHPGVRQPVRDHRDSALTPRARALWWLVGGLITAAGLAVVIYVAR